MPAGEPTDESALAALPALGEHAPPGELVARGLAVLDEAGLCERRDGVVTLRAAEGRVDLGASPVFTRAESRREESLRHLDTLERELREGRVRASPARRTAMV
jgi:hypothetical protein